LRSPPGTSKTRLASCFASASYRYSQAAGSYPDFAPFIGCTPNVELDIETSTAMANVKTDEVDVAIRWGNGDWPDVEEVKLFSDELIPVCSPAYLEELGALRLPLDLKRAVLLRHKLQHWKPWFEKARLDFSEPAQGPMFNDSALMIQAAVDGLGVALARQMLVEGLLEQHALIKLFDVSVVVDDAFYVVFNRDALERAEVAAFVQWIRSAATEDVSEANNSC
jgi:LysR family transcriptional regulator, glycine cleavage system transcriptional activator